MLGFAPLGASPLAGILDGLTALPALMGATGGITFAGSPAIGAFVHMRATGGISFGGSPFITAKVYRSATGGLTFAGSPLLTVAGRAIMITAVYENFTIRALPDEFNPVALPQSFTVRGVPE